jgi:hypothetical protein
MIMPFNNRASLVLTYQQIARLLDLPDGAEVRGFHTTDGMTLRVHLAGPTLPFVAEAAEAPSFRAVESNGRLRFPADAGF